MKGFGTGVNKEIREEEKHMLYYTLHNSIYESKSLFKTNHPWHPITYSFPIHGQGDKPTMFCEASALCVLDEYSTLFCNLSFKILGLLDQNPLEIDLDTSSIPLSMKDRDLSVFLKTYITVGKIPLYRGIYSFNELPLIVHSFLLPSLKATVKTAEDGKKTVVIDREADFGLLYEDSIQVNDTVLVKTR